MKLKSIEEEAADCRAAFKDFPVGGYVLHCHHEIVGETLRGDPENRIAYIISSKPEKEQALRLRLFRPVHEEDLKAYATRHKAYATRNETYIYAVWRKADVALRKEDAALGILIHSQVCVADCPWDGKTIFSGG